MTEIQPLVSVVCLCYNHQDYVIDAIQSVLNQTYKAVEIVVVDDASTDNSADVIQKFCAQNPSIQFLRLQSNVGNCEAFNKGFALTKGDFIIDLAADDVLLPKRIETGVKILNERGDQFGVHYCDADCVDKDLKHLWRHSDKISPKDFPEGDIYMELISRYFICPPTVMCRRSVLDQLGGYDESLAFEDFDFWIRSSRVFKYCYSDEVLVKKRILATSMSRSQYRFGGRQMRSIFTICAKIFALNKNVAEMEALKMRVFYELRQAARTLNISLVFDYLTLLKKIRHRISQGTFPNGNPIEIA